MKYLNFRKFSQVAFTFTIGMLILFASACKESTMDNVKEERPIRKSEIIAFQQAYGVSFNAISNAIENESYYESAALKHIKQNYNFDEGEVMFKIGNDDSEDFRTTSEGLLSYLIGKNKNFTDDTGIANQNWRKIDWKNNGIINEGNLVIAIGVVKMESDKGKVHLQDYVMCLKRDKSGDLKLIAHKISSHC